MPIAWVKAVAYVIKRRYIRRAHMEKRRHHRISTNLPVTIRHKGKLFPATALNLSCGGMYLETEGRGLSENSTVEVTFDLDCETRDVSLCGTITRMENAPPTRIGVQFGNLFSTSHKALREFMRKQLN